MTSPKTDLHLVIIPTGLIWDGETEYQDVLPPGFRDVYPSPHVRG